MLSPEALARQLPEMVEAIRRGTFDSPVRWGTGPDPAGVIDDPTIRDYDSRPMPGSKPFSLDEWAKDDSFTQEILAEIRREAQQG